MKTENAIEVTPRIRAIAWTAIMSGQTLRTWETAPVVAVSGGEKRQVALVIGRAWRAAQDSLKITNGKKAVSATVILERVTSDAASLRNQSLQWLDSPDGAEVLATLPDKLKRTLAKDLPSSILARQAERAKHDAKEATAKKVAEDMATAAAAARMEFTGTIAGASLVADIENTAAAVTLATAAAAAAVAAFDAALADFVANRPTAEQAAREAEHLAEIKALKERLAAFEAAQSPAPSRKKLETVAA